MTGGLKNSGKLRAKKDWPRGWTEKNLGKRKKALDKPRCDFAGGEAKKA